MLSYQFIFLENLASIFSPYIESDGVINLLILE